MILLLHTNLLISKTFFFTLFIIRKSEQRRYKFLKIRMKKFSRKSRSKNTKKVQDEIYKPSVEEEFIRSFSGSDVNKAQLITYSNIFHSSANTKSVRKFAFFTKGESKKVRYWMTPKLFIISLNIETPPIDENYFISHKFYDDKYVSFHLNPAACTNMIYFMDKVTDVLSKLEFFNRIILLTDDSNLDSYLYESICKSSIQNYSQFVEFPIAVPCSVEELKQINPSADSESHYSSTPSNVYKLTKEDGQLDYSTTQKSQNQLSEIQDDSESSPSLFISPPSTDESQVNSDFKAAAKMKDMYLQSTSQESAVSVSSSFRSSAGRRSTSVRPRKRNTDNSTNNRANRSSINSRASQNDAENQHSSNTINKKNRNSINSTASTSSRNRRNLSVTQKHRGRGNRNSINSTDNGDESEKANRASARNRRSNRNSINSSINENDINQNHRSNRDSMSNDNNISRRSGSVKKIIVYDNNENIEDNTNEISQNGQRSRRRRNRNSIDNDEYSNKYDMYSTSSRHSKANDNEDDRYDMINTTNIRRTKHRQTRNNEIEIEYDEEDIIQRSSSRHNRNHGNEIKDDRDEENENKYEMYSSSSKNSRHRKNSVHRSNSRNRRSSSTTQKAKAKNNIDINENENVNQTNSPISHTVKNRRRSKSISNTYDGSSHKKNIIGNSNSNINNSNSSNNKRNSFNGNSNNRRKIINYTSDNIDHNYKGSSLMTNTLRLVNSENNLRRNRNEIKETKEAHSEEESSGDNFTFDISNDEIEEMQRKKNSNTNTNDSSTFESRKKNQESVKQVSVLQIQSDGTSSITKTAPDLKMNHNRRKASSYNQSESGNKIVTHQVIRKANSSFHKVVKKTKVRKNLSLDLDEESSFDNPKHALSSLTNSSKYLNENPDNSEFRAINSDDTTSEEEISGSQKNSISNRSNEYDSIDAAVTPLESDSHSSRRRRK